MEKSVNNETDHGMTDRSPPGGRIIATRATYISRFLLGIGLVGMVICIIAVYLAMGVRERRGAWETQANQAIQTWPEGQIRTLIRPVGYHQKWFARDTYPLLADYLCKYEGADINVVDFFLRLGVSPSMQNADGKQPIHCARSVLVVNALLKHGADINARNARNGWTLLHYLAETSTDESLVSYVLVVGADPNIQSTDNQRTPLHNAAYYGRARIVDILLHAGAKADLTTTNGAKPVDWAISRNQQAVIDLLKKP